MTVLYRSTREDPPFGPGSFWTTQRDSVIWLAAWEAQSEAGTSELPAPRVYQAVVTMGDELSEIDVSELLPLMADRALDAHTLREHTEMRVSDGCEWMHFTDHGESWKGAMLYLGGEPIAVRLAI